MIKCPKCKGVCHTDGGARWAEDQGYIRGRKCTACGYKFRTIEMVDSEYNLLIGMRDTIEGIIREVLSEAQTPKKE